MKNNVVLLILFVAGCMLAIAGNAIIRWASVSGSGVYARTVDADGHMFIVFSYGQGIDVLHHPDCVCGRGKEGGR